MPLLKIGLDNEVAKELLKDCQGFGDEQVTDLIGFLQKMQPRIPDLVKVEGLLSIVGKGIVKGIINKGVVYLITLLIKLKILIEEEK